MKPNNLALGLLTVTLLAGCGSATGTSSGPTASAQPVAATPPSSAAPTTSATQSQDTESAILGIVAITCYDSREDSYASHANLPIPASGVPNFKTNIWWMETYDCSAVRDASPLSAVERTALKAANPSGDTIDELYELCSTDDPEDQYVEAGMVPSDEQTAELAGSLILCPAHPQAAARRSDLARGEAELHLEQAGKTFSDGVYLIGKEIKPGTYVVTGDIANCYWERQNRNGGIIANDFVLNARRVQVTIRKSDYAFSSTGCGQWKPA